MKVHDLFAAAAMVALIARNEKSKDPKQRDEEWIATLAYQYVDEMIGSKIAFEQEWLNYFDFKKEKAK
tara:strand:- start:282 stop:485 length:204 start_codon:yes stop_codon:yes gene_type:complete